MPACTAIMQTVPLCGEGEMHSGEHAKPARDEQLQHFCHTCNHCASIHCHPEISMRYVLILPFLIAATCVAIQAQDTFDPALYEEFVEKNRNLTADELQALYPTGKFYPAARTRMVATEYLDSVLSRYPLTDYERLLLSKNGFVVLPSSIHDRTFGSRFEEIFHYDLPVYVSSDAILHSMHMSYNALFEELEVEIMRPLLAEMLALLHTQTASYRTRYQGSPVLTEAVRDLDVYLCVAQHLLHETSEPVYSDNTERIDYILTLAAKEQIAGFSLFDYPGQTYDFSQLTPRGRYTDRDELRQYFQAMMWLGRTEFFLLPPQNTTPQLPLHTTQRSTVAAALLTQAMQESGAETLHDLLDAIIRQMVGLSDNVTPLRLTSTLAKAGITELYQLADSTVFRRFQDTLRNDPAAFQAINSQILIRGDVQGDSVIPASSFVLLGQRFIIDSYISQNVVYDRVQSFRMMPSAFDILFALGNNAAAQLLQPELDTFLYAPQLAGLRYLVDSYDDEFWGSSLYNAWLQSIRTLNTPDPDARKQLPTFMQTAAWWQLKMSSQLAAWSQLRHDNLLYAKQSYTTGVPTCSFPFSYVEPVPDFFRAVAAYADTAHSTFTTIETSLRSGLPSWAHSYSLASVRRYFEMLSATARQLGSIAEKELSHIPLSEAETTFLKGMLYRTISDYNGGQLTGWYPGLFYGGQEDVIRNDYVVADIHTQPTDTEGNLVGNIYHAGTGPVHLAIIMADCGEGYRAYIGPVFSYYERITEGFERLTDEEWEQTVVDSAHQLNIAYAYMTPPGGQPLDRQPMLDMYTTAVPEPGAEMLPVLTPNPTSGIFVVEFPLSAPSDVEISLYSQTGERIALLDNTQATGRYSKTFGTENLAAGTYYVVMDVGGVRRTEVLVKR